MRRISFAMTWEAIKDGSKTMTRRKWKASYARRWKKGDVFLPISKARTHEYETDAPRVLTTDPYQQQLRDMPDRDFEREGGRLYWPDKAAFIQAMGGPEEYYWVIEFELVKEADRE